MKKYEYTTVLLNDARGLVDRATLNKLGADGWRVVQVVNVDVVLLEREIASDSGAGEKDEEY